MSEVQDIKTLNFGEQSFNVEEMSPSIQQLVRLFNIAQKREASITVQVNDLTDDLTLVRASKEALYREINNVFTREQEAAANTAANEESAESEVPTAPVAE